MNELLGWLAVLSTLAIGPLLFARLDDDGDEPIEIF